jgi:hypothetical protein
MRKIIPLWSTLLKLTAAKSSSWVLAMIVFPPLIKALENFKHVSIVDAFVFKLQSYYIALAYISISFWLIKLFCPKEIKDHFLTKKEMFEDYKYSDKQREQIFNYLQNKGHFEKESISQVTDSDLALLKISETDRSLFLLRIIISFIMLFGAFILIVYFLINVANISSHWLSSIHILTA